MADIRELDRNPEGEARTARLYRHTLTANSKRWTDDPAVIARFRNAIDALEALENIFPADERYEFIEDDNAE